jgi:hypothetical protein
MRVLAVCVRSSGMSGAENATNVLRLTLEPIVALLTSSESAALALEIRHTDWGKLRSLVVGGSVMVNLVDRDNSVDNVGLDDLLVHYGLNVLVDVMVDMLSANGGSSALGELGVVHFPRISELGGLSSQLLLCAVVVAVIELAVLDSAKLVLVVLWQNLAVMNRLHCAVVVVLVYFAVGGGDDFLVPDRFYNFVLNSRSDSFVDSGVVVSRLGDEVLDGCFGFLHFEGVLFGM